MTRASQWVTSAGSFRAAPNQHLAAQGRPSRRQSRLPDQPTGPAHRMGMRPHMMHISLVLIASSGCGGGVDHPSEAPREAASAFTSNYTDGDWSDLPDGLECVPAARRFFEDKFGASFPLMPEHSAGDCPPLGACHLWLDAQPDSNVWERIDAGDGAPQTYDLVVYPPHGTGLGAHGHVGMADHVEDDQICVMDDNYVGHHQRSSKPHSVSWAPYGWYRLRNP